MERIPELARYGNGWWPPVRLERFVVFREDCALFAEEAMRITLDDAEVITLDASHIDELLALPERTKTRRVYELRLAQGNLGLAVRHDGRIIAIMWAMLGWFYYGADRMPLHSDEAYVFDGYVVPAFRGHGLAGYMWHALIKRLADGGRTRGRPSLGSGRARIAVHRRRSAPDRGGGRGESARHPRVRRSGGAGRGGLDPSRDRRLAQQPPDP